MDGKSTMTVADLAKSVAAWFSGSGAYAAILVSSRIRLARNLAGLPFTHRATGEQRSQIITAVRGAVKRPEHLKESSFLDLEALLEMDRQLIVERRLISPALAVGQGQRGVVVGKGESYSVMINEEDHVRLQTILSGFQLKEALDLADRIDNELARFLDFAFSSKYGYLTACPTNVGTGLRASVLIHLPALVLTEDMQRIVRGISDMGLTVRGFYGEGSEVVGNLFQISNQITLGRSEHETVDELEAVTKQIIDMEQSAREVLIKNAKSEIEDKICRAIGILDNARLLTTQEFMNLSSATRLGVGLGIVSRPMSNILNELMVLTQPSHLQHFAGRALEPSERDELRASMVRRKMADCN